jgi:hypothetical protein
MIRLLTAQRHGLRRTNDDVAKCGKQAQGRRSMRIWMLASLPSAATTRWLPRDEVFVPIFRSRDRDVCVIEPLQRASPVVGATADKCCKICTKSARV